MQGFRARATAGREEGLPQSPPHRPRRSRRSAYIPAAVPLFPDAPFPAAPKPQCLVVPLPRCPVAPLSFSASASAFSACLRTPKPAFLESRARKNSPLCPKTGHFGVPNPKILTSVPQNQPFWGPSLGNTTLPLGKTGIFAHPRPEKQLFVGQNRHFCPSEPGKTALRWAKQAFLPIRARKKRPPVGQNRRFCPTAPGRTPTAVPWQCLGDGP